MGRARPREEGERGREREGGRRWAVIGPAEEGEDFSFFVLFSLFFFLNSLFSLIQIFIYIS
jgi:hypothetical protein